MCGRTRRPDGDKAAELILEAFPRGKKPGREAMEKLMGERGVRVVDFDAWKKIDAAETAAANDGAPRAKLTRIEDMLSVLDG